MIFLTFIINWAFKLLVAWLFYLLAVWLQVPEWMMIAMIAVGAAESKISLKAEYK